MSLDVTPGGLAVVQAVAIDGSEHAVDTTDTTEGASDDNIAEIWVSVKFTHAGKEYTLDLADSDRFVLLV